MDNTTQPTQQATQATQRYLIEKFSQEQIDDNIVCRVICTTGQIPIRDLRADVNDIINEKESIKKVWSFGRNPKCDYYLGEVTRLSNKHFQILLGEDGNLLLKDTSTNGTWLNGLRLEKNRNQILSQGDEITVGVGVASDVISLVLFVNDKFSESLKQAKMNLIKSNAKTGRNSKLQSGGSNNMYSTGIFKDFSIKDEVVGQGAFAIVKKAVERSTGKTFAVKIINKRKVMGNMDGVTRELDVLRKLDHPRIVRLKGFYEDEDSYYLLMEFVSGGDLMDFVAAHGSVGEDAGREITRQILEAVKYIHLQGISHRDLKPDNILIEQDDPVLVKITDFGLAKVQGNGTFMKTFCGTLAYVAPEVIGGKNSAEENEDRIEYSSLVDMWSIGCLVYVILTGHLPFSGSTQDQLYKQICRGSYHEGPLKDFRISDEARDFIDSLLQVSPNKRLTAIKALNHPWIKMGTYTSQSFGSELSQVSLSQSLSQQKVLENMDDAQYEFMKARKKMQYQRQQEEAGLSQLTENKQGKFKVPTRTPVLFTQARANENETTGTDRNAPQRVVKKGDGKFVTLHPIEGSLIQEAIIIKQGINPYFIGRSDDCNCNIEDSRLSRVHCFILKNRHIVGNSIYESPAQGLDDIWYCHTGSNISYINNVKVPPGYKVLLHQGDEIKIIWDKHNNSTIGFKMEINDTTGLFNDGSSVKGHQEAVVEQREDEKTLVKRLTQMMAVKRAEESSSISSPVLHSTPQSQNLNDANRTATNILKRVHSVSLSQSQTDPNKKVKRAVLDPASKDNNTLQFL
ncbi:hypothetical protein Kpol_1072p16 [Vanderwaltozyma polyspora DSM 70294]|uniref:Serine/threonine-protein kinase RAD53 n=1 Tax=Vanderwaltozyma polyspora (strain ATCC 22028 / DSM 70294 / BCRC 21397 / CBS 2163 / NBRC 10782 / NRRL Y-8283 / UCD 57-17) TaxID=436907 RepID=A7TKN4_VANPO|nr:uncharacterized protein Kpol_1072p16 [Vanderwaltozyma polyspora DSM 70294]EDO17146.1 hypothetical protein Kpol_1072p16 [Vanderwaltozyma polyspora DSM 70294]